MADPVGPNMPGPGSPGWIARDLSVEARSKEDSAEAMKKAAEAMSRVADAVDKATEATEKETKEREESSEKLLKQRKSLENLASAIAVTSAAIEAMGSMTRIATSATGDALISNLGSAINNASDGIAKTISAIAPEAKMVGMVFSGVVHTATALIEAADAATTAQRGAGEAILSMGGAAKDTALGFGTLTDTVIEAGTKYNFLQQQQAVAVAKSMAEAGIATGATAEGASKGKTAATALSHSVELASMMYRANGLELSKSTEIVARLGTQFQLSGESMDNAYASFVTGAQKSGVSFTVFAKEFDSVSDSIKTLGGTANDASALTSSFAKELQRGSVTAQQLAAGYSAQAGGLDKMLGRAAMIMAKEPELASKMGLRPGMSLDDIIHTMNKQEKAGSAYEEAGGLPGLAKKLSEGSKNPFVFFQEFLKDQGMELTQAMAEDLYKNPRGIKPGAGGEGTAKTLAEQQVLAKGVLENLGTAADKMANAAKDVSDIVLATDQKLGLREKAVAAGNDAVGVGKNIAQKGLLGWFKDLDEESEKKARSMGRDPMGYAPGLGYSPKKRGTGGLIGDTGMYKMHAGEMVHRPGEGGGISISAGGIHVSIGSFSDVNSGLDQALGKLKVEIMSEIDSQWQRAQFAQ